tara:strand:- start:365 stop:796 length:432 start_codon:yes stop_codon:yes gene_type:complete
VFNQILKIIFSKPRIISTFASFVVIYFFPWIFYAYLAVDFFESQVITDVSRGDDMLLLPLTLGCLIMAYLFSLIYEKWGLGSYNVRSGIQFGVLIGLFFGAGIGLVMYGTEMRMTATGHLVDAVFWVVTYAVTGVMASIAYKR